ncbi:unnamed protein product, partial [Prorocentrum cordatum]
RDEGGAARPSRWSVYGAAVAARRSATGAVRPLLEEPRFDVQATVGQQEWSLQNWRVIVQTAFASCMSTAPFAAFSLTGGVYGRDEGMDRAAIGTALALFKLGRLGTLVVLNALPECGPHAPPLLEPRHLSHLLAAALGVAGALCTLGPSPRLLCAGALLLGFGWTDPILQVHAAEHAGGCKAAKVQLLGWIWRGRLLGMLLGAFGSGYLYDSVGWGGVVLLLGVPHLSYLVAGALSLQPVAPKVQRRRQSPGRLTLDATAVGRLKGFSTSCKDDSSGLRVPFVLLLLSACCVAEYTLGVMLSTMPLYFTTGLGCQETIDLFTFGAFDTLRVALATSAVVSASFCSRRCQRRDGERRGPDPPVWVKLAVLCPLYALCAALPLTRHLHTAMAGHLAAGVLYNLVGPILSAEYLCALPEGSVKLWVSVKTVAETLSSSLGSFYGPFALASGDVAGVFLVPTALLLAVPAAERVGAWCSSGRLGSRGSAAVAQVPPRRQRLTIKTHGGLVIQETVAVSSTPLLGPLGHLADLRAEFQGPGFWANNSQAMSCLAVAFSALGQKEMCVDAVVAASGIQVHHALGRPLTHLAVKTMLQHIFLARDMPLAFLHTPASSFEDLGMFEDYLRHFVQDCVVLLNFATDGLEKLYEGGHPGQRSPVPPDGWAIPARMTDEGLVQLVLLHGDATAFVRTAGCPSALLLDGCRAPSLAPGLPRDVIVLGPRPLLVGPQAWRPPGGAVSPLVALLEGVARRAPHAGWRRWHQPEGPSSALAAVAACLEWNCGVAAASAEEVLELSSASLSAAIGGRFSLEAARGTLGECAEAMGLELSLEGPVRFCDGSLGEFAQRVERSILAGSYPLVSFDPRVAHGVPGGEGWPESHFALAIACDLETDGEGGGLLMLDPDPERYGRYWSCSVEALWKACLDEDPQTEHPRGLVLATAREDPDPEIEYLAGGGLDSVHPELVVAAAAAAAEAGGGSCVQRQRARRAAEPEARASPREAPAPVPQVPPPLAHVAAPAPQLEAGAECVAAADRARGGRRQPQPAGWAAEPASPASLRRGPAKPCRARALETVARARQMAQAEPEAPQVVLPAVPPWPSAVVVVESVAGGVVEASLQDADYADCACAQAEHGQVPSPLQALVDRVLQTAERSEGLREHQEGGLAPRATLQ